MTLPEWMICSIFMGLIAEWMHDYAFRQLILNSSFSQSLDIGRIGIICLFRGFAPLFAIRSGLYVSAKLSQTKIQKQYLLLNHEQKVAALMVATFFLELSGHFIYKTIGLNDLTLIGQTESRAILMKIEKEKYEQIMTVDLGPLPFESVRDNYVTF